jgi:hypothetical protein
VPQGDPTKNHQNHKDKQNQQKPIKPAKTTKPDGIQRKMSRVILTQKKRNLMEFKGRLYGRGPPRTTERNLMKN